MDLGLHELRRANDERAELWRRGGPPLSLEFSVIELCGETGELANAIKKYLRAKHGIAGGVAEMEPIVEELADVVICADLLAKKLGIDLAEAVRAKFNKTSDKMGFDVKL